MTQQQIWAKVLDLVERGGWTFIQAIAASIYAAGAGTNFSQINWATVLVGAAIATALSVLKTLGISASQAMQAVMAVAAALPALEAQAAAAPPPPPEQQRTAQGPPADPGTWPSPRHEQRRPGANP